MRKFTGLTILKSILLLSVLMLPLLGSDCNNILNNTSVGSIQGTWKLNFIQGNLQDVCLGEVVNFPNNSSGTATLTCPGQTAVQRTYTVSGNTLTFQTGVTYTITSATSSVLILTGTFTKNGVTSTRILSYAIVTTTGDQNTSSPGNDGVLNSSEVNNERQGR